MYNTIRIFYLILTRPKLTVCSDLDLDLFRETKNINCLQDRNEDHIHRMKGGRHSVLYSKPKKASSHRLGETQNYKT
jgi:hypothetical protein